MVRSHNYHKNRSKHHKSSRMRELPLEIILCVLEWLPVKSLLRFKCVSKQWHGAINSKHFVQAHLKRGLKTKRNDFLLIQHKLETSQGFHYYSSVEFPNVAGETRLLLPHYPASPYLTTLIVGSCNGLICSLCYSNGGVEQLAILNPTTRDFRILPPLPFYKITENTNFFAMRYGFGHDAVTDEYKVVVFFRDSTGLFRVLIFSSAADSWIDNVVPPSNILSYFGTFTNSALHYHAEVGKNEIGRRYILSFDLHSYKFGEISLPGSLAKDFSRFFKLVVLGGCLSVCSRSETQQQFSEIWVMKEYMLEGSWTKLWSIPKYYNTIRHPPRPLVAYDREEGEYLLVEDNRKLLWYGKNGLATEVEVPRFNGQTFSVGSLIPVFGNGESTGLKLQQC